MHSPVSATIDASVLAIPIYTNKEEAFNYIETLINLSSIANDKLVSLFLSEKIQDILFSSDLFPLKDKLSILLESNEIKEFNSKEIFYVISKLLRLQPSLECNYCIRKVESKIIETDPSVLKIIDNPTIQDELLKSVTMNAILNEHCSDFLGHHLLFLKKAPKRTIQITAEIINIEHDRDDLTDLAVSPDYFKGNALICDEVPELIKSIDHCSVLANANDEDSLLFAIRVALFKSQSEDTQSEQYCWDDIEGPKIGNDFLECCKKICKEREPSMPSKILDAIVKTVTGKNTQEVHELRRGKGASEPQKKRGNDKAYRQDVDHEIHLHYWKCEDKSIELASLVYHNDFTIPQ